MAVLNAKTIWEMEANEIDDSLIQMRGELMKIRGVLSSGGIPEDVGKAREIRRTIARLKTIQHQREKEGKIKSKTETESKKKPTKK
ncbi:50S ribosomal protein L29 [Candidatus Altiarchaeota archaeon]